MKAAIFRGPQKLVVEDIPMPKAGENGVVVKVRAVGICGSDLHAYRNPWERHKIGVAWGHEWCGDVVEAGKNVSEVGLGDRITGRAFEPCYKCEACNKGQFIYCARRKSAGVEIDGGFAEYIRVPFVTLNQNIFKLTPELSYQDGALTEPLSVGAGVVKKLNPRPSDIVVIQGAGIIGLGVLAQIKSTGVSKVIISDISEKRLTAASSLGADIIVNPLKENLVQIVMQETSNRGANLVIEAAGIAETFHQSIEIVCREGKVMVVAYYKEPFMFNPSRSISGVEWNSLVSKAIEIVGGPVPDMARSFNFLKSGKIKADQVVSHVYPLERISEAFQMQMNPYESIKVMLDPSG